MVEADNPRINKHTHTVLLGDAGL